MSNQESTLGIVPDDWNVLALSDLGSWGGGSTPRKSNHEYWGGSMPWVSPKDMGESVVQRTEDHVTEEALSQTNLSVYRPGSVVVVFRSGVLRHTFPVATLDQPFTVNQDMKVLTTREEVDDRFVFHLLRCMGPLVLQRATKVGTTVESVDTTSFKSLPVGVPAFREQRRIADVLDTVDAAIREMDDVIAKQEQVKTGLLQDLLTRGLDADGQLRDPASELNWEWKRLGSLSQSITSGSRGWAKYYSETGSLFLRIGNLSRRRLGLDLSDEKFVDLPDEKLSARSKVKPGDVLISITADLGIVGLVPGDIGRAFINQHIALVRPMDESYLSDWIAYFLAGESGQKQFYRLNDAGAKAGLNLTSIGNLKIPVPQPSERERIVNMVRRHERNIESESSYRSKLQRLKTGLMQDLLTGQVRVPEAEERIQEITR